MEQDFSKESLKRTLDEIRGLIDSGFEKQAGIPQIEKDLVLEKLRSLYDLILNYKAQPAPTKQEPVALNGPEDNKSRNQEKSSAKVEEEIYQSERDKTEIQTDEIISKPEDEPEDNGSLSPKVEKPDLFSTFTSEPDTIGDKLKEAKSSDTIAEQIQKNKIGSLKVAIGINDKFFFVNELFDGKLNDYNSAIDKLDAMPGIGDAIDLLGELKNELEWNAGSEAFQLLKQFVERKYS